MQPLKLIVPASKQANSETLYLHALLVNDGELSRVLAPLELSLFALSLDPLCIAGFDGYFKQLNPAWSKLLGWTNEELLDTPYLDFIHPDDHALTIAAAHDLRDNQQICSFENRYRCKDGSYRWLSWNAHPLTEQQLIFAVTHDITERKQAEQAAAYRLAELEAVNRVSTALRIAQTQEAMLTMLLDEILNVLPYTDGGVWLYENGPNELRPIVLRGWFEQFQEQALTPGVGIVGQVFVSGEVYHAHECMDDQLSGSAISAQLPTDWSGICVPLRADTAVVGVLCAAAPPAHALSREASQGHLLSSLAEIAGTALHRLRLHQETARRLEHLQALRTIDQAITSSMDARITLTVLLSQVISQLGVDAAGILLFNPSSMTLDYAAGRGFRTHTYEQSHLRIGEGMAGRAAIERQIVHSNAVLTEPEFARAALLRSEGFVGYIGVPFVAKGQIKGVLEVFCRSELQPDGEWLEFLATFAGQAAIAIDNLQLFEGLQRSNTELMLAYDTTIEGWSRALDLRDKETEGHTQRVTEMTLRLARAAGLTEEDLVHLRRGALLHDIGKMGIPDNILLKPGSLSAEEWEIMRRHPTYAYELLAPISYLRPALDIPYCHHEKWDGSGYPRGLKGEQIPLAARLFAVVDVWDALRSDRPYRHGWPENKIYEHIRNQTGSHFDPEAVALFFMVLRNVP
jgi:PAS domain S-box-containing protein